jgi:hypothetical protein
MVDVCQVDQPTVNLSCTWRESGGYRCEVVGPHEQHKIGEHTIRHSLAGNGHTCSAIDGRQPHPAVTVMRDAGPTDEDRAAAVLRWAAHSLSVCVCSRDAGALDREADAVDGLYRPEAKE